MNSFAAAGVLALLVASLARPTVAQTIDAPHPPAATMPPEPVAPSSPLAPLTPRHTPSVPRRPAIRATQHVTVPRVPAAQHARITPQP
jgi:hypothetical protein